MNMREWKKHCRMTKTVKNRWRVWGIAEPLHRDVTTVYRIHRPRGEKWLTAVEYDYRIVDEPVRKVSYYIIGDYGYRPHLNLTSWRKVKWR